MTVHASKGLEFANVFVVGLEENIFPSPMASDTGRGLEEERRLLYVAITRAERRCIITNAQNRFRFGSMQFDSPSRFINDIDPRYLTQQGASRRVATTSADPLRATGPGTTTSGRSSRRGGRTASPSPRSFVPNRNRRSRNRADPSLPSIRSRRARASNFCARVATGGASTPH